MKNKNHIPDSEKSFTYSKFQYYVKEASKRREKHEQGGKKAEPWRQQTKEEGEKHVDITIDSISP